ncbi:dolichol monophosphate mannose synthase [Fusobacterium nucleatum YWH7199]|uniref:glycosyltransferase family 2 protein n=1 Tax=Fusobacterium nucleatum TaxID=851 RepID=UPI00201ABDDB|nr:glycosyltransferase family 2 protein [Fusobacterium nucleatum]MCL4581093.1 dolichol monophosphate mannose synthase [Fusobacterium nucleatum YWH7199]
MKKISIFSPCYNEELNLEILYNRITDVMEELKDKYDYEIVFIDNKSKDNSRKILRKLAEKDKRVKVIFNTRNFGPGRSGAYGLFQTTGEASIALAADLQDPPELIPQFLKKWEEGYKVVWGQKTESEESKFMYFIRKIYYKIIRKFSENKQIDNITGYGLYDKKVVQQLKNENNPHPIFRYSITEFGYDVSLITYKQNKRLHGKSSYNFFRYLDTAITALISTSRFPLRMITYCGFLLSGFCFFTGLYYLVKKILYWDSFQLGLAPLIVVALFIAAIQMIFIGILGEYLNEVLNWVVTKPLVIEEERINFEKE